VLIHIGYHKTASTWLQKRFFIKENGYFKPLSMSEIVESFVIPGCFNFNSENVRLEISKQLFSLDEVLVPLISHERLSGDPFTGGRDAKEIAGRLHETFPNGKILIVVREQCSIISSLYKTYVALGGTATLKKFLFPPQNEEQQWFDPSMYKYDVLIRYYCQLFGRRNVLVMNFDDLLKERTSFCKSISSFGNATIPIELVGKENESLSDIALIFLRYFNILFGLFSSYPLSFNRSFLWRKLRGAVYRLDRFTNRIKKPRIFKQQVEENLGDYFVESNHMVEEYLGEKIFKTD
jgi:hypothetical protein